jgi:hypothetical protein
MKINAEVEHSKSPFEEISTYLVKKIESAFKGQKSPKITETRFW